MTETTDSFHFLYSGIYSTTTCVWRHISYVCMTATISRFPQPGNLIGITVWVRLGCRLVRFGVGELGAVWRRVTISRNRSFLRRFSGC